jgi:hypothetical protein
MKISKSFASKNKKAGLRREWRAQAPADIEARGNFVLR